MIQLSKWTLTFLIFVSGSICINLADHCPEDLTAAGAPEHILAGIDLTSGKLEDVIAFFGDPSATQEGTDPDYPAGSGYATYEWKVRGALLTVETEFYHDDAGRRIESLAAASLASTRSAPKLGTSRGLRLGDTWARAQRVYGHRYVEGTVNGPDLGPRTVTYCFTDETELELGLDADDRVVALRLAPTAE